MKNQPILLTLCLILVLGATFAAHALDNKFTYEGRLTDNSSPATAEYQMQFRLRDGPSDASAVLATAPPQAVSVVDGLFSAPVDFPIVLFDGSLADYGTVGGGVNNLIGSRSVNYAGTLSSATIAGGNDNSIEWGANYASVGGGKGNRVTLGDLVAVPGGSLSNAREILAQVAALPLSRWNYKTDGAKSVHLGPMAQDFHAAFALGADDKHIATVDADGVALAAIQGLHELVREKDARISALEQRLTSVEKAIASLHAAPPMPVATTRSGGGQ